MYANTKCLGLRLMIHGAIGVLLGYLILYPISMLIHHLFPNPYNNSIKEVILEPLSLAHIQMAGYFSALGLFGGLTVLCDQLIS